MEFKQLDNFLKQKRLKKDRVFPAQFNRLLYDANDMFMVFELDCPARFGLRRRPDMSSTEFYELSKAFIEYIATLTDVCNIRRDTDLNSEEEYVYFTAWDPVSRAFSCELAGI